jgi:hypothetical protein
MIMKYLSLAALVLVACGVPKQNQLAPRDGFQYDIDGETVAIVYESNTSQPNNVDIDIQVNGQQFEMGMSSESGLQSFDGHGSVLTTEERKALAQAAQDYAKQNNVTESSPLEQKSLYLAFDYLSNAPENYTFPTRNYRNLNLQNEGISCIKKGATINAQWSTRAAAYVA